MKETVSAGALAVGIYQKSINSNHHKDRDKSIRKGAKKVLQYSVADKKYT